MKKSSLTIIAVLITSALFPSSLLAAKLTLEQRLELLEKELQRTQTEFQEYKARHEQPAIAKRATAVSPPEASTTPAPVSARSTVEVASTSAAGE
ncbi:MAG TPA: carbohydrate porin, partial [Erwinia persicina]|nr:carbohydrate porin [Erwinia persicina]HBI05805.1 carbohydrate porin [Erwinia persicina]HBQ78410.1 carbohydrate porin [Erwinia persicina]